MKYQAFNISLVAAILLLSACSKKTTEQRPDDSLGTGYFPDKVGSWVEYQVDSLWRIDALPVLDSVSYRLRQVIAAHYTDPAGRPAMRIERFTQNDEGEWIIRDVWTATRSNTAAEMTEENKRRLKLSFPIREGRTWDTNVYNTDDELLVAARDVDASYTLNGHSFARTVAVRSTVPPDLLNTRDLEEIYAYGVGMIEHHWHYRKADLIGPNVPEHSVRYSMVMVDHGE